jgi:hypothetical protein
MITTLHTAPTTGSSLEVAPRRHRTRSSRARPSLFTPDEARFVAEAARLILPPSLPGDRDVDVVAFLDRKLGMTVRGTALPHTDVDGPLFVYRRGIAAVQRHCQSALGARFEVLSYRGQLTVLSLLEDEDTSAGFDAHTQLLPMLIGHVVEAYFDSAHTASSKRP